MFNSKHLPKPVKKCILQICLFQKQKAVCLSIL